MLPVVPSTPLRALSTVLVRVAFCWAAASAVVPCVTTPTSSWALSGLTEIVALPLAWMAEEVCVSSVAAESGRQIRIESNLRMMCVSPLKYTVYSPGGAYVYLLLRVGPTTRFRKERLIDRQQRVKDAQESIPGVVFPVYCGRIPRLFGPRR